MDLCDVNLGLVYFLVLSWLLIVKFYLNCNGYKPLYMPVWLKNWNTPHTEGRKGFLGSFCGQLCLQLYIHPHSPLNNLTLSWVALRHSAIVSASSADQVKLRLSFYKNISTFSAVSLSAQKALPRVREYERVRGERWEMQEREVEEVREADNDHRQEAN